MDKYRVMELLDKLPEDTDVMVLIGDDDAREIEDVVLDDDEYKGGYIAHIVAGD